MTARAGARAALTCAATRSLGTLASVALLALIGFLACDDGAPSGPDENGFDLSRYVAIGNSLTAGYMNGALGLEGQSCSYPRLLAGQAGSAGVPRPLRLPGISERVELGRIELLPTPITIVWRGPGRRGAEPEPPTPGNLGVPGLSPPIAGA